MLVILWKCWWSWQRTQIRLRLCPVVCLCVLVCLRRWVCVGGIWRGREGLYLSTCHCHSYLGGHLALCLNGLWCLHLVSKGSDRSEGRNWETHWIHWYFDFVIVSSFLHYSSLCWERLTLRERHTQNTFSQLDTKAEVLSQLTELFNIVTARNFEIVIWQIKK